MNETTDATAVFAPLWRRKWLILAVAILAAAGSYLYYKHQPSVYSATTQVYLGSGAEEQAQLGTSTSTVKKASALNPTTQGALINSSIVKEAVRERLRREHRGRRAARSALKGKAKAKASEKSEFVVIEGEASNARGAALLVNTTAQAFVQRQNTHYRAQVATAIALTRKQLRKVETGQLQSLIDSASSSKSSGSSKSSSTSATAAIQSATLDAKINQLESDLGVAQVTQVNPAKPKASVLVSPHPKSNALFGFAVGLLLAALAAYALNRLDRRLRSLPAVEEVFEAPILSALQSVRHPLIVRDGHPAPAYVLREALWRLQATLQAGSNEAVSGNGAAGGNGAVNGLGRAPRTILLVSPDAGDGKSTLVAALALAWGEAGERVAVVEADFRRPVQAGLLRVSGSYGLADVLAGMVGVEKAMQPVGLMRSDAAIAATMPVAAQPLAEGDAAGGAATVVEPAGSVSVLVGGTKVANPPALLGRPAATELVRSLTGEFDHVLIDAPSPLQVSDAIPLLGAVDGIIVVARVGHTRATSAQRLVTLLQRTPSAPVLGVVANAVSAAEIRKYGIQAGVRQYGRGMRYSLIGR